MSSAFVHSSAPIRPTVDVEAWLAQYWDPAVFTGADNSATDMAIHFSGFRKVGSEVFADPVGIVPYRTNMSRIINGGWREVLIPLGVPIWNDCTQTVLSQSARQWVHLGVNAGGLSDEHILMMFYGALQSLVFTIGTEADAAKQNKWLTALVSLTRTFSYLHSCVEGFKEVTAAMVATPGVNDMLQKALAHVFCPHAKWDAETKLEMLDIVVRRNLRNGTPVVGLAPGPLAVFLLVPLLRQVAFPPPRDGMLTVPSAVTIGVRFNAQMDKLLGLCAQHSKLTKENALVALSEIAGCPLTPEAAAGYLEFAEAHPPMSVLPPWSSLGVLPPQPPLSCAVGTDDITVKGVHAHAARVTPISETSFKVVSFKGVAWTGFSLSAPGTYSFRAHSLGIAKAGEGNTLNEELVANLRVTTGSEILPADRAGYSSAGMEHRMTVGYKRNPYDRYGDSRIVRSWGYVQGTPMDLKAPFTIVLASGSATLSQGGKQLAVVHPNLDAGEQVLIGFKNLWLEVAYDAPRVSVPAVAGSGAPLRSYAAAVRGTTEPPKPALTPVARLAQLRTQYA